MVCSRPSRVTICFCQVSAPRGRSRATRVRTGSSSFAVIAALTCRSQSRGRSAGQSLSSPCKLRPARSPRPPAAPAPRLGAVDRPGGQGVALDLAAHGEKVAVGLDGEALEPPRVEVATADDAVSDVPAHDVGAGQPADEAGQLAVLARPEHEMPVIAHEAPRKDAYGRLLVSLDEHPLKRGEILELPASPFQIPGAYFAYLSLVGLLAIIERVRLRRYFYLPRTDSQNATDDDRPHNAGTTSR